MSDGRLGVRKTYKLYVGGQFPRSESGRTYPVLDAEGHLLAHAVLASRKDVREAVRAARGAQPGWAGATAYNRGQVLYRVAEIIEGRRSQFVDELAGAGAAAPHAEVDASVDRWVWYAGWADKLHHVVGTVNPVAGPYYAFTVPEPVGVVGLVAGDDAPLLGLVSRLAPALVAGNATVAIASERSPLVAIALGEALATSDVPAGVVNLLTGRRSELVPWLAGHHDVDTIDLSGLAGTADGAEGTLDHGRDGDRDREMLTTAEQAAAAGVKRVVRPSAAELRWFEASAQSPYVVASFLELKSVWHPIGF